MRDGIYKDDQEWLEVLEDFFEDGFLDWFGDFDDDGEYDYDGYDYDYIYGYWSGLRLSKQYLQEVDQILGILVYVGQLLLLFMVLFSFCLYRNVF